MKRDLQLNKFLLSLAVSAIFISACQKENGIVPSGSSALSSTEFLAIDLEPAFVGGELIVKFRSGVGKGKKEEVLGKVKGLVTEKILTKAMMKEGETEGLLLVRTSDSVKVAIQKLKQLGEVEYAEPNYILKHDAVSNDPFFTNGSLWGMQGDATIPPNQFGSQAGEAWLKNHVGSKDVIIGIIDEGVMINHEDLASNIWINPFETADGIDNDGNGYIDDINGWDFSNNDRTVFDGMTDDHGTHVAGTIGAQGGNGRGVAGVSWNISMIVTKFLGENGGTLANAIKATDYITDLKTRHKLNIRATNNSWGGVGFSQALHDAIERANKADILFVAAAGNEGANNDRLPSYPSGYPNNNVIAVASITSGGTLSGFSNYGVKTVDLGAPGSNIYSTLPGSNNASAYGSYSGTSMATPHVTGAVALYAAANPASTAAQVRNAILSSVVKTSSLNKKCVSGGRLNLSGF